jgi:predicted methyltransferase
MISEQTTSMSLTEFVREAVRARIVEGDQVIDATVGNGYDTLWLAQSVGALGRVYGFDIQASALTIADQRITKNGVSAQVIFFNAGHESMDAFVPISAKSHISAICFNLGYLPNGDKSLTTLPQSTLCALHKSMQYLKQGGCLSILCYPGHPEGSVELNAVRDWVKEVDSDSIDICCIRTSLAHPVNPAPIAFLVTQH